jgi:Tfp pilus assembly protein PilN
MKEEINLLPLPIQTKRLGRLYVSQGNHILQRLLIVLFLILLALGLVYWVTWQTQKTISSSMNLTGQNDKDLEREVRQTNEFLQAVATRLSSHPAWTPVIRTIFAVIPPEVSLKNFEVSADTGALSIKGTSTSRAAVIELQKSLEGLPTIQKVEAPLQNFASGPGVEFSFTLYRKPIQP